jgi:hypothetical protein
MWAHRSSNIPVTPPGGSITNHAFYSNFEGGIAYKPPVPFALTAGYRYQRVETQFKSAFKASVGSSDVDETKGPVLGISFIF